jgi:hypothetical protein
MATLNNLLNNSMGGVVPAGTVVAWGANNTPNGYIHCNGAAISRTLYADLFAAIGGNFGGGDGSTTFNVPDLRGEFIRGFDDGRGADSGRGFASAQAAMMPRHRHQTRSWYLYGWGHAQVQGGSHFGWGTSNEFRWEPFGDSANERDIDVAGGLAQGTDLRPRNVAMRFCIKF